VFHLLPSFLPSFLPSSLQTANVAKIVSSDWRTMQPQQKDIWEEKARIDKARYEEEMAEYRTNIKINGGGNGFIPKRPMSAYLAYSNKRRAALKRMYPDATNAELSKMLAAAWKTAPLDVKAEYVEDEARLRALYNHAITPYRNKKPKKPRKKRVLAVKKGEAPARAVGSPRMDAPGLSRMGLQSMPTQENGYSLAGGSLPLGGGGGGGGGGYSDADRLRMLQGNARGNPQLGAPGPFGYAHTMPFPNNDPQQLLHQLQGNQLQMARAYPQPNQHPPASDDRAAMQLRDQLLLDQARAAAHGLRADNPFFENGMQGHGNNQTMQLNNQTATMQGYNSQAAMQGYNNQAAMQGYNSQAAMHGLNNQQQGYNNQTAMQGFNNQAAMQGLYNGVPSVPQQRGEAVDMSMFDDTYNNLASALRRRSFTGIP
jgi:hypothetical protein